MRSEYIPFLLSPSSLIFQQVRNSHESLLETWDFYPASVMVFSSAHRAAITARRAHKAPPTEATALTADPVKGGGGGRCRTTGDNGS